MEEYIKELKRAIILNMQRYDFKEGDIIFGGGSQIKGFIMGLKTALYMAEKAQEKMNETGKEDSSIEIDTEQEKRSRSRRRRE